MGSLLNKTRVIFDSLGGIHGFCATMLAGEPFLFSCTNGTQPRKGNAMILWDGAGQPKIINLLPAK